MNWNAVISEVDEIQENSEIHDLKLELNELGNELEELFAREAKFNQIQRLESRYSALESKLAELEYNLEHSSVWDSFADEWDDQPSFEKVRPSHYRFCN